MAVLPQPVTDLVEAFASLPGIGPKSASRLAFYLLRQDEATLSRFGERVTNLRKQLVTCTTCQNIASQDPCDLCRDPSRDTSLVCVVEDALDVVALEKSGQFRGRYHVLQGVLSPLDGIGPEQLKVRELEHRLIDAGKGDADATIKEVVLALNPTVEGEATALFIQRRLQEVAPSAKVTRLAHGLPVGADLEYADEVTLARALEGRTAVETQR
ncbi:MAG: recombination mediator RecR [Candidatus Andersenbacteria bacterium]